MHGLNTILHPSSGDAFPSSFNEKSALPQWVPNKQFFLLKLIENQFFFSETVSNCGINDGMAINVEGLKR